MTTTPLYQREFPDFDPATMPAIPEGFDDYSWHNNASPCFQNRSLRLCIFVDYADQSLREVPGQERFFVFATDPDDQIVGEAILATDDWNAVLHYVADCTSEFERQMQ